MYFADKIMLLSDGQIVKYGEKSDFVDGKLLEKVYHMDIKGYMQNSLKMWNNVF
jgi:iron complex transport system ATP-binding protein